MSKCASHSPLYTTTSNGELYPISSYTPFDPDTNNKQGSQTPMMKSLDETTTYYLPNFDPRSNFLSPHENQNRLWVSGCASRSPLYKTASNGELSRSNLNSTAPSRAAGRRFILRLPGQEIGTRRSQTYGLITKMHGYCHLLHFDVFLMCYNGLVDVKF